MIKTFINSNVGFSLIEVIVAMLIFTIVSLGFSLVFTSAVRNNQATQKMSDSIRESVSNIDNTLADYSHGGSIPEEMILADNAEMTININGQEIKIEGYIVEGSLDVNNKAFFPKTIK